MGNDYKSGVFLAHTFLSQYLICASYNIICYWSAVPFFGEHSMCASCISVKPAERSILFGVQGQRDRLAVSKLTLHCTQVSDVHSTNRLAQHYQYIVKIWFESVQHWWSNWLYCNKLYTVSESCRIVRTGPQCNCISDMCAWLLNKRNKQKKNTNTWMFWNFPPALRKR